MTWTVVAIAVMLWNYFAFARMVYRMLIASAEIHDAMREVDASRGRHTSADVRRYCLFMSVAWPYLIIRELIKLRARR